MALAPTVSRNPRSIDSYDGKVVFPVLAGSTMNVGDIVVWDTASNLGVRTPATQADMTDYVGVAEQQIPVSSNLDEPNAVGIGGPSMLVMRNGLAWFFCTAGDTYAPFNPVFFNETLSVQTVTSNTNAGARTKPVGFYFPGQQQIYRGGAANLNITGVAGQLIQVWLTPAYPVNLTAEVI